MSEENVERIREAFAALNRGDLTARGEYLAPECEFHEDPAFPEAGVYRGRADVVTYVAQFREHLAGLEFELEEIHDLGDRVLAMTHERARGAASGADVDLLSDLTGDVWDVMANYSSLRS